MLSTVLKMDPAGMLPSDKSWGFGGKAPIGEAVVEEHFGVGSSAEM